MPWLMKIREVKRGGSGPADDWNLRQAASSLIPLGQIILLR